MLAILIAAAVTAHGLNVEAIGTGYFSVGPLTSSMNKGGAHLLKDGAAIVLSSPDVGLLLSGKDVLQISSYQTEIFIDTVEIAKGGILKDAASKGKCDVTSLKYKNSLLIECKVDTKFGPLQALFSSKDTE